jgi:hypothetical protein
MKNNFQCERLTSEQLGINQEKYLSAVTYLFDRPVRAGNEPEWYWGIDVDFEATSLEWTRIQTLIFQNAGEDLKRFSDEQIGMGLNYLMSNGVSNVSFAASDESVPLADAMKMVEAFPLLWRDCISPRTEHLKKPIGLSDGMLAYVCYMWFDVTPLFRLSIRVPEWRDALQRTLLNLLYLPSREVVISALHGIGHHMSQLNEQQVTTSVLARLKRVDPMDQELIDYAHCALKGSVQ